MRELVLEQCHGRRRRLENVGVLLGLLEIAEDLGTWKMLLIISRTHLQSLKVIADVIGAHALFFAVRCCTGAFFELTSLHFSCIVKVQNILSEKTN